MKSIKKKYIIYAPIGKVWRALVDPKVIDAWGGGPAKMDGKIGTKFSLWGGDIHGINKNVVSKKKLIQEWFGGDWTEPSILTIELSEKNSKVDVTLTQINIPDQEAKDIDTGWDDYYFGPLKDLVEKQ